MRHLLFEEFDERTQKYLMKLYGYVVDEYGDSDKILDKFIDFMSVITQNKKILNNILNNHQVLTIFEIFKDYIEFGFDYKEFDRIASISDDVVELVKKMDEIIMEK